MYHSEPWEYKQDLVLSTYEHTRQRRVKTRNEPVHFEEVRKTEVDKPNVTETKQQSRRAEEIFKTQSRVLNKTDPPGRDVPPKRDLEPRVLTHESRGNYNARKPVEVPTNIDTESPDYVSPDLKLTPKTKPEEIAEVRENWNKKYPLLAQSFVKAAEFPTTWREQQPQRAGLGLQVEQHRRVPWELAQASLVGWSAASLGFSQTVRTTRHH